MPPTAGLLADATDPKTTPRNFSSYDAAFSHALVRTFAAKTGLVGLQLPNNISLPSGTRVLEQDIGSLPRGFMRFVITAPVHRSPHAYNRSDSAASDATVSSPPLRSSASVRLARTASFVSDVSMADLDRVQSRMSVRAWALPRAESVQLPTRKSQQVFATIHEAQGAEGDATRGLLGDPMKGPEDRNSGGSHQHTLADGALLNLWTLDCEEALRTQAARAVLASQAAVRSGNSPRPRSTSPRGRSRSPSPPRGTTTGPPDDPLPTQISIRPGTAPVAAPAHSGPRAVSPVRRPASRQVIRQYYMRLVEQRGYSPSMDVPDGHLIDEAADGYETRVLTPPCHGSYGARAWDVPGKATDLTTLPPTFPAPYMMGMAIRDLAQVVSQAQCLPSVSGSVAARLWHPRDPHALRAATAIPERLLHRRRRAAARPVTAPQPLACGVQIHAKRLPRLAAMGAATTVGGHGQPGSKTGAGAMPPTASPDRRGRRPPRFPHPVRAQPTPVSPGRTVGITFDAGQAPPNQVLQPLRGTPTSSAASTPRNKAGSMQRYKSLATRDLHPAEPLAVVSPRQPSRQGTGQRRSPGRSRAGMAIRAGLLAAPPGYGAFVERAGMASLDMKISVAAPAIEPTVESAT